MAISPLIMVRFEKFEIVCTQDFGPDLQDVTVTLRVTSYTWWRHAREGVMKLKIDQVFLSHYAWRHCYQVMVANVMPSTVNNY